MRTLLPLLFLSCTVFADTITLTNGEKVEGRVVSESATELTVEYRESAGITDQKVLKKSDVTSVVKEQPDEAAWKTIKDFKLGAYSLPARQYDEIAKPLTFFASTYPQNAHIAEVKKMQAAVEAEKARVDAGEVKVADKWLSKEDAQKERYQINGLLAFNHMKSQRTAGDLVGALNTFDQLEKTYPGSKSYPDAVDFAKQVLAGLKATVTRAAQQLDVDAAGRATASNRAELEAAAAREQAAGEAAIAAAERAQQKWPALSSRSTKNLTALGTKAQAEIQRLAALDVAKMRQSILLADKARSQIAAKDLAAAEATLREATTAWGTNETLARITADIASAKTAAIPEPAPVEEPKPVEKPVEKPKAEVAAAPVVVETVEIVETSKPFLLTLPGAVTAVVLIAFALVGLNVFRKLKSRANETLE